MAFYKQFMFLFSMYFYIKLQNYKITKFNYVHIPSSFIKNKLEIVF